MLDIGFVYMGKGGERECHEDHQDDSGHPDEKTNKPEVLRVCFFFSLLLSILLLLSRIVSSCIRIFPYYLLYPLLLYIGYQHSAAVVVSSLQTYIYKYICQRDFVVLCSAHERDHKHFRSHLSIDSTAENAPVYSKLVSGNITDE